MKLKVESRILYRLQFVMHVLNCPLKLYLTNSHRHLDLLCLLIDPRFPNDSFKQKNSRVFYIPKKRQVLGIANILQTICCFKQVHKKWGVLCFFVQANLFVLVEFRSMKLPFTIYTVVLNDTFHPLKVCIFTPKGFTGSDAHIVFHFYLFIVYITVTQWFQKYFSHCGNNAKKFKTKLTHFEKKY